MQQVQMTERELPWLSMPGTVAIPEDVISTGEAVEFAGLDWTVSKLPVYFKRGDKYVQMKDRFVMARDKDDTPLGTVGSHYVPCQNVNAFEFVDPFISRGDAQVVAAGPMRRSRVVFLVLRLNIDPVIIGGDDEHDIYMLLRTSHDASKAINWYIVMMRRRCMQQMQLSGSPHAPQQGSVPHVTTIGHNLQSVDDVFELALKYGGEFQAVANKLADSAVTVEGLRKVLTHVLPVRPKTPDVIDSIADLYETSPTNGFTGTGWGALNAVTEYYDWGRDTKSPEARFLGSVDGGAAVIRNRAANLVTRVR